MLLGLLALQFAAPFGADLPEPEMVLPHHRPALPKRSAQSYPQILLRPIFAPDRQPMLEILSGYSLLGTGIAGPLSTAIVQGPGSRMQRLRPGDRLAGWQVSTITPTAILFQRSKERRMLKLDMNRLYVTPGPGHAGQARTVGR